MTLRVNTIPDLFSWLPANEVSFLQAGKGQCYTRVMSAKQKVYKTFDDLIRGNRPLFKFFGQKKQRGLFKAIWDSRQIEIDRLKQQLDKETEKSRQDEEILIFQEDKILGLEKTCKQVSEENDQLKKEYIRFKNYSDCLEKGLCMSDSRLRRVSQDNDQFQEIRDQLQIQLNAAIEENKSLKKHLEEQYSLQEKTLKELDDSKAYIRTQRRLNSKMSGRLLKTTDRLERMQYKQSKAELL